MLRFVAYIKNRTVPLFEVKPLDAERLGSHLILLVHQGILTFEFISSYEM